MEGFIVYIMNIAISIFSGPSLNLNYANEQFYVVVPLGGYFVYAIALVI